MKKAYKLQDLDCANCAAKMQNAIGKIQGVKSVSVNFLLQKLTIEAEDEIFDEIVNKAVVVCRKIEPSCAVLLK